MAGIGLLKILVVIILILFLIKKKWDLGLVLFLGAALTGLLFRMPPLIFGEAVLLALISKETVSLVGIIILVLYLGSYLESQGAFRRMIDSLKSLVPDPRLVLALPPAFIGLLPMLGGALMSAPIVEEAGRRWNLAPAWKTFLNYWFRHIWEYCWPLYINIIMAAAIIQVPIMKISVIQSPFTFLAVAVGLAMLFRHVPFLPREKNAHSVPANLATLFLSLWPLLLAIVLIFAAGLDILLSLGIAAVLTQVLSRMKLRERTEILLKSLNLKTILLLAAVMVFKRILEESGALNSVAEVVRPEGVLAVVLIFAVPFALGFLTGVNHAFVMISFPLLLPIFGQPRPEMVLVLFAYVSGFVGILLSPAHLCLVLTVDYFRTRLKDVYRILIGPSMIILGAALAVLLAFKVF